LAGRPRRQSTDAESLLWSHLRSRQLEHAKFVRQLPIGSHVADFACRSLMLVIELDGGQHADSHADAARTRAIEAFGYRVIRFWNNDVMANTDGVLEMIAREVRLARNVA
jgi:very-short-patch-repair endonuclease